MTYRINPTVLVPKHCSKTCCGNGHILPWLLQLSFHRSISRPDRLVTAGAWLMLKKRRRDHVTPLLKELHWLPVKFHCQYKIATLAYRHFEGSLPPYFCSSLCTYELSRCLWSNEKLLKIPKQNLKSSGQRSFSFMAPSLWNSLPATLRNVPTLSQFKSQLKTLFAQAFM